MKKIMYAIFICAFTVWHTRGQNYVETAAYSSLHTEPVLIRIFSDGFGNHLQTQRKLNTSGKVLLSAYTYDETDPLRLSVTYKPYPAVSDFGAFVPLETAVGDLFFYYNDPQPATTCIAIHDPLQRPTIIKEPGNDFFQAHDGSTKVWYFGTKEATENPVLTSQGFIRKENLHAVTLNQYQNDGILSINENPDLFLTVYRDPNDHYSQKIMDRFGHLIRTADDNVELTTQYEYASTGNLLKETPPQAADNPVNPTTYLYNTRGQLLEKNSPDAGSVRYAYNNAGLMCFSHDANQRYLWENNRGKPVTMYLYDIHNRLEIIGILDLSDCPVDMFEALDPADLPQQVIDKINSGLYTLKIRFFYDAIYTCAEQLKNSTLSTIDESNFTNTNGQLVATIAYNEGYNETANSRDKIIEAFSYNLDGTLKKKYKAIPQIQLQIVEYYYTERSELIKKVYKFKGDDESKAIVTEYEYDADNNLITVKRNGTAVTNYSYYEYGPLKKKNFSSAPGDNPEMDITYDYTIRDWTKSIQFALNQSTSFSEKLYYANIPEVNGDVIYPLEKRQYNGNIGRIQLSQWNESNTEVRAHYSYDLYNRLTQVRTDDDSYKNYGMDADFSYDISGRMLSKTEGYTSENTPLHPLGNYKYGTNNNRLAYLDASGTRNKTALSNPNYVYDDNGNMVLDRSKRMTIIYDWRNMPVMFKFLESIPDQEIHWSAIPTLESTLSVPVRSYVTMTYDASGNRVSKEVFDPVR